MKKTFHDIRSPEISGCHTSLKQGIPAGPDADPGSGLSRPMSLDQLQAFAERDYNMECLADAVEARFLIAAPRDLKESVLKAAARPEVRLEHGTRKLSKKAQLFFYSLKVGTAVAGALLLLAAAPDIAGRVQAPVPSHRESLMQESLWNIKKANDRLSGRIRQFSNDIFQNGGN